MDLRLDEDIKRLFDLVLAKSSKDATAVIGTATKDRWLISRYLWNPKINQKNKKFTREDTFQYRPWL
jgi:hypothetical protein